MHFPLQIIQIFYRIVFLNWYWKYKLEMYNKKINKNKRCVDTLKFFQNIIEEMYWKIQMTND